METGIIVGQIFKSLWEAIKELEPADQIELYNAIFQYQFTGELPNFKNKVLGAMFKSQLPVLDKLINNQKNRIEANRRNGKLGGRPKTDQNPQKPIKTQENPSVILDNPKKPTKTLINNNNINNNNINNNIFKINNIKEYSQCECIADNTKEQCKRVAIYEINGKKYCNQHSREEIRKLQNYDIKEKSVAVVEATALTPQVEVFNYFAKLYKQETNIEYLGKGIDYINLAKLIKKYGKALVIQKIRWLLIGCKNSVFWFSKDINDFTISTLTSQWDRILPKLTEEQKKEQDKLKKEAEKKKWVMDKLKKQGIVIDENSSKGGLSVIS